MSEPLPREKGVGVDADTVLLFAGCGEDSSEGTTGRGKGFSSRKGFPFCTHRNRHRMASRLDRRKINNNNNKAGTIRTPFLSFSHPLHDLTPTPFETKTCLGQLNRRDSSYLRIVRAPVPIFRQPAQVPHFCQSGSSRQMKAR